MSICKILGVPFQNITPGDAEERIVKFLHQSGKAMVFTPNPEMVMAAQKDEEFMKILRKVQGIEESEELETKKEARIAMKPVEEPEEGPEFTEE